MRFLPSYFVVIVLASLLAKRTHLVFAQETADTADTRTRTPLDDDDSTTTATSSTATEQFLLSLPSPANLRAHLYNLTRRSHVAGTPGDYYDARYVLRTLSALPGFEAHIEAPEVMLTYPASRPQLVAPAIEYVAKLSEDVVRGDDTSNTPWRNHTFNAYSPSGNVTAKLVYANYGRPQDFDVLSTMGISVKNKIVIMRYGECFRGLKVMNAESRGAAASIIYSDPAQDGYSRDNKEGGVYPNGPWRPPSGVQRGSVQFNSRCAGDPWRLYATSNTTVEDICGYGTKDLIPSRPVLPISYQDASPLLSRLGGPSAPTGADFQGGLEFAYTVGPSSFDVTLVTDNKFVAGKIPNVIATMQGSDDNDEDDEGGIISTGPIILGNHRDAWVFGAVDPNSGTLFFLRESNRALQLICFILSNALSALLTPDRIFAQRYRCTPRSGTLPIRLVHQRLEATSVHHFSQLVWGGVWTVG